MSGIKQGLGLNLAVDISGSGPRKNKLWGLNLLYGKCHSFFTQAPPSTPGWLTTKDIPRPSDRTQVVTGEGIAGTESGEGRPVARVFLRLWQA